MLIKLSGWDREIFARRLIFLLGFIKFKLSRSKRQNEPFEKSRNWRSMVTLNMTSFRAALGTAGFSLRWPRFPCTKRSWTRASKRDVWWSAYASLPIFVPFSALAKTLFWNQGRVSTMASIAALLSFKFGSMESGWTWLSTIDCPRLMASLCTWAQVRRDLITIKSKRYCCSFEKWVLVCYHWKSVRQVEWLLRSSARWLDHWSSLWFHGRHLRNIRSWRPRIQNIFCARRSFQNNCQGVQKGRCWRRELGIWRLRSRIASSRWTYRRTCLFCSECYHCKRFLSAESDVV